MASASAGGYGGGYGGDGAAAAALFAPPLASGSDNELRAAVGAVAALMIPPSVAAPRLWTAQQLAAASWRAHDAAQLAYMRGDTANGDTAASWCEVCWQASASRAAAI